MLNKKTTKQIKEVKEAEKSQKFNPDLKTQRRTSSKGFKACITILGGLEGFLHEFEMASKSHKLANPVTSST